MQKYRADVSETQKDGAARASVRWRTSGMSCHSATERDSPADANRRRARTARRRTYHEKLILSERKRQ
jgi:hypothetical protein